jgi:hypothetical protein
MPDAASVSGQAQVDGYWHDNAEHLAEPYRQFAQPVSP